MISKLQVKSRKDLVQLVRKLGLNGVGVELGVKWGGFSRTILRETDLKLLFSVDPWLEFRSHDYDDFANVPQLMQNFYYIVSVVRLAGFKDRNVCLRMKSEEAINWFNPESLDFIYIDANHSYEGCQKDMEIWWPKLRRGGIFAGHDYLEGKQAWHGEFGVKKAVDEFVEKNNLELFVTQEKWPSWYFRKK